MTSFKPLWATPERPLEITRPPVEEEAPPAVFQSLWGRSDTGPGFQPGAALVAERTVATFVATGGLAAIPAAPAPESMLVTVAVEQERLADVVALSDDDAQSVAALEEEPAAPEAASEFVLPQVDAAVGPTAAVAAAEEAPNAAMPEPAAVGLGEPVAEPVAEPARVPAAAPVVVGISLEEHEAALAAVRQAAWDAGRQSALDEVQQALEAERAALRAAVEAVRHAVTDTRALAAPVKRLSLHLAEQLVRGELATSAEAIHRLVDGCLAEIDPREAVALRLHPEDVAPFQVQLGGEPEVTIMPDATLARGSVRVELTEGWVEDLIEDRLDTLSRALLDEPWTPKKAPEPAPRARPALAESQGAAPAPRKDWRAIVADEDEVIYAEPLVPRDPVAAYREDAVLEHDA